MCENSRKCEKCGKFSSYLILSLVQEKGTSKAKWLCEKCELENEELRKKLIDEREDIIEEIY